VHRRRFGSGARLRQLPRRRVLPLVVALGLLLGLAVLLLAPAPTLSAFLETEQYNDVVTLNYLC